MDVVVTVALRGVELEQIKGHHAAGVVHNKTIIVVRCRGRVAVYLLN